MLAVHTPAPVGPRIRNEQLDMLAKNHQYEIATWPAYFSDKQCMDRLRALCNVNPNILLYVAMMKGITPIVTIGDHKAFIVDFTKKEPDKKNTRQLPKRHDRKLRDIQEEQLRKLRKS